MARPLYRSNASSALIPVIDPKTGIPNPHAVVCFPGSRRTERVMPVIIGRRELIAAPGGAAVAWPFVARAQQPPMPMVEFLGQNTW
jgi:hypothetical protein